MLRYSCVSRHLPYPLGVVPGILRQQGTGAFLFLLVYCTLLPPACTRREGFIALTPHQ